MTSVGSSTSPSLLVRLKDVESTERWHEAWREFVDRYGPKIRGWCRRWHLQPADMDDVTQSILTKLVGSLRRFDYRELGGFRGWLRTVTTHAVMDFFEASKRRAAEGGSQNIEVLGSVAAACDDLDQQLDREHERRVLELAMTQVSDELRHEKGDEGAAQWSIFLAIARDGQPAVDVAGEFGRSVDAVRMVKMRVQAMIKRQVQRLMR